MTDKLAIIVPYRDRQEHLDVFVPHMHEFLKDKGIDYTIFIAEQTDDRPFNYGKLCNIVTKEIGEEYTYFAFHDIDMLPTSDECDYGYPDSPTHLATNVESHNNELPYPQYFGGVVLISREDFETANGYSNEYWGYGFEDLDLLYRLQRSGAYLEKFYDLNNIYSHYDELDVLPYRIENVKITSNKKRNKIQYNTFDIDTKLYGPLNSISQKSIKESFSISFWFNDDSERTSIKKMFAFEGCDTGLFLSSGNELIGQIWDTNEKHHEVLLSYSRNSWNYCSFSYSKEDSKITLTLNNKSISKDLPKEFELYDYSKHCIRISEDSTSIKLSNILVFDSFITSEVNNLLYSSWDKSLDVIKNKFGILPAHNFYYDSIYNNNLLIDKGKNLNHIKIYGNLNYEILDLYSDEIYLPFRLQGEYKSLVHDGDSNIVEKYYTYNPDIMENSDIFFHDVLTGDLNYDEIGLSTMKYTILDIQNRKDYELVRIVT
jgi:hypothetical protein